MSSGVFGDLEKGTSISFAPLLSPSFSPLPSLPFTTLPFLPLSFPPLKGRTP